MAQKKQSVRGAPNHIFVEGASNHKTCGRRIKSKISLDETEGEPETDQDGNITNDAYEIVPGTSQAKDPTVSVSYSLDSYVFVEVTDTSGGLVTWEVADGWELLSETENTDGSITYVYYRLVEEGEAGADVYTDSETGVVYYKNEFSVLKDDSISYSSSITNEDVADIDEEGDPSFKITDISLSFHAYIIQAQLSDDADPADPATAYVMVATGATVYVDGTTYVSADASSIQRAIEEAGTTPTVVVLTESVTVEDSSNAIVVGEGQDITIIMADEDTVIQSTVSGVSAIENSGTLTVIGGTVDATQHATAAVTNNVGATMTLSGVTVTRSSEAGTSKTDNGGNSYYYIENQGDLTLDDCIIESDGAYSSLIHNGWYDGTENTSGTDATLTINGGTYTGGLNTIKNDDYGVLVINDGTFTNSAQHAVFNANVTTINGGTFTSTVNAAIYNVYYATTTNMDQGILNIYDGTFESADGYAGITTYGAGTIGVYGGTWNTDTIVADAFSGTKNNYVVTDNGDGTYTVSPQSVSTVSELTSALSSTPEGGVIELASTTFELTSNVTISSDVTIVGSDDTVITGSGSVYIKSGADVNVTFEDVTFSTIAGTSDRASFVYATSTTGTLTFDGCNFTDTEWDALQITVKSGESANIVITNCVFDTTENATHDHSNNGISVSGVHRYIHIEDYNAGSGNTTVTITNCTFNNNDKCDDDGITIYGVALENITVGKNATDSESAFEGELWISDGTTTYCVVNSNISNITGAFLGDSIVTLDSVVSGN